MLNNGSKNSVNNPFTPFGRMSSSVNALSSNWLCDLFLQLLTVRIGSYISSAFGDNFSRVQAPAITIFTVEFLTVTKDWPGNCIWGTNQREDLCPLQNPTLSIQSNGFWAKLQNSSIKGFKKLSILSFSGPNHHIFFPMYVRQFIYGKLKGTTRVIWGVKNGASFTVPG